MSFSYLVECRRRRQGVSPVKSRKPHHESGSAVVYWLKISGPSLLLFHCLFYATDCCCRSLLYLGPVVGKNKTSMSSNHLVSETFLHNRYGLKTMSQLILHRLWQTLKCRLFKIFRIFILSKKQSVLSSM